MRSLEDTIADVRADGRNRDARCPAHDDARASLSVGLGADGRVLLKCQATCETSAVLDAAGLTMRDLFGDSAGLAKRQIVATHAYHDEGGAHLYDVVRFEPKDFRQRRADGVWSMQGVRRVLYRLDKLQGKTTAYVVEGEKDADRLWALGLPATTAPGGAGKWRDTYAAQIKAATVENVVILPDNDDPGREGAEQAARSCHAAGLRVKLVMLPDLPAKGDVSDYLAAGHTRDDLAALVKAAPVWTPTTPDVEPEESAAPRANLEPDTGLDVDALHDAVDVAAEGRAIADAGIAYLVDGLIPDYGMLGMEVAYAKVGKTTFGQALGAAVASGRPFLDRAVKRARVLALCPEDPPEYTAWLARHLDVPRGQMTFYRGPIRFNQIGLDAVVHTVKTGGYGAVLVSSWQAVIAGLVESENDNAAAVAIVEMAKQAARLSGVPWLVDAHSGKGEDQSDDADPLRALRGASAAAGAADYMLSLRYADGPFSSRRRLSGKGRFVSLQPMLLDYDLTTGTFTALGDGRSVAAEQVWTLILTTGILDDWAGADAIARAIGEVSPRGHVTGAGRRKIAAALRQRPGIDTKTETRRGQSTTLYRRAEAPC